ncbi:Neuroligin-1, partial [Dissophora globulifera]
MSLNSHQVNISKQGTVQGALDPTKRVVRFLNVPYGTVSQRWRPPFKPEPWSGVRDATKQSPIAPQPTKDARYSGAINTYSGIDFDKESMVFDEKDCLHLNIYVHEDTLARAREDRDGQEQGAAVMVYIHGGALKMALTLWIST